MTTLHSGGKFDSKVYNTSRRPARRRRVGGQRAVGDAGGRGRARPAALPHGVRARRAAGQAQERRRHQEPARHQHPLQAGRADLRQGRHLQAGPPAAHGPLQGLPVRRRRNPLVVRAEPDQGRHAGRGHLPFPRRPEGIPGATIDGQTRVTKDIFAGQIEKRGRARLGRMGGVLDRRRGRLPQLLLQHHPDGRGRHARERPALGADQGPARFRRAGRQPAGGADHRRGRAGHGAAMLSVFIREPEFQGQTKDKLATQEATRIVENAVRDAFDHWLADQPAAGHAPARMDGRPGRGAPRSASARRRSAARRRRASCACPASWPTARPTPAGHRDLHRRGRLRRRLGQAGARPRDARPSCRCAARSSTSPTPPRRSCRRTSCCRT